MAAVKLEFGQIDHNIPDMENQYLDEAAVHAYLELIELNMRAWRPEVSAWLHSDEANEALGKLLALVPCSPSIH